VDEEPTGYLRPVVKNLKLSKEELRVDLEALKEVLEWESWDAHAQADIIRRNSGKLEKLLTSPLRLMILYSRIKKENLAEFLNYHCSHFLSKVLGGEAPKTAAEGTGDEDKEALHESTAAAAAGAGSMALVTVSPAEKALTTGRSPSKKVGGLSRVEDLVQVIKYIGTAEGIEGTVDGVDIIIRHAPEKLHSLIPNLEVFLQVIASIKHGKSKLIMALGEKQLTDLIQEMEFPWQLKELLMHLEATDYAKILDLCDTRFDSIILNAQELAQLLRGLNAEAQLHLLARYTAKLPKIISKDLNADEKRALLGSLNGPASSAAHALLTKAPLLLQDDGESDLASISGLIIGEIVSPAELTVLFLARDLSELVHLFTHHWDKISAIVAKITTPEELFNLFKPLTPRLQSLFLQRILQANEALVLYIPRDDGRDESSLVLHSDHGSKRKETDLMILESERPKDTSSKLGAAAAQFPELPNRALLIGFLPEILVASIGTIREFSTLLAQLKPKVQKEMLAEFFSFEVKLADKFWNPDLDATQEATKLVVATLFRGRSFKPFSCSVHTYALALAYRDQLEKIRISIPGLGRLSAALFSPGANIKIRLINLIINFMETGEALAPADATLVKNYNELNRLLNEYLKDLKAAPQSPSLTEAQKAKLALMDASGGCGMGAGRRCA